MQNAAPSATCHVCAWYRAAIKQQDDLAQEGAGCSWPCSSSLAHLSALKLARSAGRASGAYYAVESVVSSIGGPLVPNDRDSIHKCQKLISLLNVRHLLSAYRWLLPSIHNTAGPKPFVGWLDRSLDLFTLHKKLPSYYTFLNVTGKGRPGDERVAHRDEKQNMRACCLSHLPAHICP